MDIPSIYIWPFLRGISLLPQVHSPEMTLNKQSEHRLVSPIPKQLGRFPEKCTENCTRSWTILPHRSSVQVSCNNLQSPIKMKFFTIPFSKIAFCAVALLGLLSSCAKEEMQPEQASQLFYPESDLLAEDSPWQSRFVDITYHYNYNGDRFTVVHTVDQTTSEILESTGEVEKEDDFISNSATTQNIVYDVSRLGEQAIATTYLFDSVEELEAFLGEDNTASKSCNYWEDPGSAIFQYFEHAGHTGHLSDLTKPAARILNWNNVMSHNNDKISSFYVSGGPHSNSLNNLSYNGMIRLYHDICYGGSTIYFLTTTTVLQVPNLAVIGPRYNRSYNNDKTSSIKGYWSH